MLPIVRGSQVAVWPVAAAAHHAWCGAAWCGGSGGDGGRRGGQISRARSLNTTATVASGHNKVREKTTVEQLGPVHAPTSDGANDDDIHAWAPFSPGSGQRSGTKRRPTMQREPVSTAASRAKSLPRSAITPRTRRRQT